MLRKDIYTKAFRSRVLELMRNYIRNKRIMGLLKKKHKAELYDKIQSVIGNYNDRMVRGIFKYDFDIDAEILRDILVAFCKSSPIMHSSFCKGVLRHKWIEKSFVNEDIFFVKYCDTPEREAEKFICTVLPVDGNVQLKIGLFKDNKTKYSILAMITNHMYMDGGDFKYFMKKLCTAYNQKLKNTQSLCVLKNGSRGYDKVYDDLEIEIKKRAKLLYSNPTPKNTKKLELSQDSAEDISFIIKENIPSKYFAKIKEYGKKHNATINDLILSAYFQSLCDVGSMSCSEAITISGAIDLRRYILDSDKTGITNHSTYLPYTIANVENKYESILNAVTEISRKYKDDPFTGLYGLPLLKFGYSAFPAFMADKLVKKFYNNPTLAMSNIGILYEENYRIGEHIPSEAFITGTVKYKPGIMVTVTTYKNEITLTMCCRGNEQDKQILSGIINNIKEVLINISL